MAAPVRADGGRVAAGVNIAVNAMEWTMDRILTELRPRLTAAATDISHLLGQR